jgi:hypothetical protein
MCVCMHLLPSDHVLVQLWDQGRLELLHYSTEELRAPTHPPTHPSTHTHTHTRTRTHIQTLYCRLGSSRSEIGRGRRNEEKIEMER